MRILVLSCHTGGGHNTAAAAISECLLSRGIECDTDDALRFVSRSLSNVVRRGHDYAYRHLPRLFGVGYRYEETHSPKFIYNQIAKGAKKFAAFVSDRHYDAIICTHIFGNMLVTKAAEKYGVSVPHYAVITDYAVWPGTDMVAAKRFFIAADCLVDAYRDVGISNERITVSGIPVGARFLQKMAREEARHKLAMPIDGKVVLLACGSIGCGNLTRHVPELERALPSDTHLVVVCGKNKKLHRRLSRSHSDRTTIVGYTNAVHEYMAASDLCITKPGGLSTTEMLVMKLPMVLMLTVPGCESHNLAYFEAQGGAVSTDDWGEAISLAATVVRDDEKLAVMRDRLAAIRYPGGADTIVDKVLEDIRNGK